MNPIVLQGRTLAVDVGFSNASLVPPPFVDKGVIQARSVGRAAPLNNVGRLVPAGCAGRPSN